MGRQRVEPGPGRESVWDYPRPPRLERTDKRVKVVFGGVTIAYTTRVLETSHPPVYYVPPEDVRMEHLRPAGGSFCERTEERATWYYPDPVPAYREIKDHVAFYPVGGEKVRAQDGDFYGGWITPDVVGPFKGAPGTWGW